MTASPFDYASVGADRGELDGGLLAHHKALFTRLMIPTILVVASDYAAGTTFNIFIPLPKPSL